MTFIIKLLNIFSILIYPFSNILILLLLGLGLTYIILPKSFKPHILWLSPWMTIIVSIFYFVIMSLFGFSVNRALPPFIIVLIIVNIYVLVNIRSKLNQVLKSILTKENLILGIFVSLTLILNLFPVIRHDKMLATVSLGNNDVIVYVNASDYLKNHSIAESYKTKINLGVKDILQIGYRWGTPMINAFFLTTLNLQGYQYTYVTQAVLFSLFIPLVYILFKVLLGRSSLFGLLIVSICTGLNVNLLYILYHNFFGQVLFWGLETLLLIFIYSYFNSREILHYKFNRYDFILGILITVFYYSYHEPAIFMFTPLAIFLLINLFYKKKKIKYYFLALLKIGLISFITGFRSIINAFIVDYIQVFVLGPKLPMGWQLFRSKIPYANPFEAMGFWSIHNFDPLPTILAIVLCVIIILIFMIGIIKSKTKILTISYLIVFSLFFYWTGFHQRNFFAYNRALTYTLPLIIVLFSIGLTSLFKKQKLILTAIVVILISLELWSAINLNKRFIREHLSVEKSFVSILDLKKIKFKEPVYAEYYVKADIPYWKQIWTDHFLYETQISALPTIFNTNQLMENKVFDNSLVLISKPTSSYYPTKVILKNTIWENEYYRLGRLCDSEECLLESNEKLSEVETGESDYADTLLLRGWDIDEGDHRWTNEKESWLRLVVKDGAYSQLMFEAVSLKEPQKVTAYVNDQLVGEIPIKSQWQIYHIPLSFSIIKGVYRIKFVCSNGYIPSKIIPGNLDNRTLYINFKKIGFE